MATRFRFPQPGRKIGCEKEADKPDIQLARSIVDRGSLRFICKYCVDYNRMTLRKDPNRALHKDFINLLSNLRLICALGQPIRLADLK